MHRDMIEALRALEHHIARAPSEIRREATEELAGSLARLQALDTPPAQDHLRRHETAEDGFDNLPV